MTTGEHQAYTPTPSNPAIEALRMELRDVRDAGLIAHGKDGKNGRLSEARADLASLSAKLWGVLFSVVLSIGMSGYQSCVVSERRTATLEAQIVGLEKAIVAIGAAKERLEQQIQRLSAKTVP